MPTAQYLDQPYLLAGRRIDPITGTLSYREEQKHLRRKELEVLAVLAEAGTESVPRSVFIQQLWPTNPLGGEQSLTEAISTLRRALVDTDRENPLILTLPRRGYQLRASVRLIARDGGVAFVAGTVIEGRPDWRLKQLLERTDAHESWLAEDGRSRRIFRFCRNEQQLRKLQREIVLMRYLREALASVENVSTILDWQLEEPPYFLELAAPACGNLRGVMLSKSAPETPERWHLLQQVAEALASVHAAGVVHRDLGPDSVLVDRRDGERVALLGEFGLAALDDRQRLAELGIDAGGLSLKTGLPGPATTATAPECIAGAPASAASDVYALGVLIVRTVRGDFLQSVAGFEDFPAEMAALLQRCCAANPAARPSAAEVAARLRDWTQPKPAPRSPEPTVAVPDPSPAVLETTPEPVNAAPRAVIAPNSALLTPVPQADQHIDRYRVVSELAEGGMGVVYLAEQNEPVRRRVAVKLVRAGLDSKQVLARFEAERQALALMSHPNIAAIFDAGTTSSGYPYFVMEFVPGKDIVSHCDDARLDLRARIRLFLQVCDGVLHAHQKGLIHRDLKPGNILVKPKSNQEALVKLIDFGVAKSLSGSLGAGLHTRAGGFVGTPVYSCPEQIIDPTRDIDTRADLYSLGVILYEILAGVTPRSAAELETDTPAELARRLRDTPTPPMGKRYTGLSPEERQRIAALRALSADALSIQLGSDIDWIVGKCVARDPDERYATVQELRQDLQRWLDDRPVEARPSSAWYRFRKMVRRNRLNATLVLLAGCALVATSAAAVVGFLQARAAAADAEQIAQFQQRQWEQIDAETLGIRMRERLKSTLAETPEADTRQSASDRLLGRVNFSDLLIQQLREDYFQPALQTIEQDYADRPHLQHQLWQSMAESLYQLGIIDTALIAQELALQRRTALLGPQAELTLYSLLHRSLIHRAKGNTNEADADAKAALQGFRATLGRTHPSSIKAAYYAGSDMPLEELLAYRIESHGEKDALTLMIRRSLANRLRDQKQYAAALAKLAEISEVTKSDPKLLDVYIRTQADIGIVMRESGDIDGSIEHLESALRRIEARAGTTPPRLVAVTQILLYTLATAGRAEQAEALARRTLQGWHTAYGDKNPWTIWMQSHVSEALWAQGRLPEAIQLSQACLAAIAIDHPDRVELLIHHAEQLGGTGQLQLAKQILEEGLRSTIAREGRAGVRSSLGHVEHLAGNLVDAEKLLSQAQEEFAEIGDETSGSALVTAGRLASVWRDLGRTEQARELFNRTWPKQRPWQVPSTLGELAILELEQGNISQARALASQAIDLGTKHMHPKSPEFLKLKEISVRANSVD